MPAKSIVRVALARADGTSAKTNAPPSKPGRHVDEERPAPRQVVDEETARERPGDEGQRVDEPGVAEVAPELGRRCDVGDERHRETGEPAGARALQRAGGDELRHRLREPAEHRCHEEQRGRGEQDALATEAVAERAVQRDGADLREEIRAREPREQREPPEIGRDRRCGGRDDRRVDTRHRVHEQERGEGDHQPPSVQRRRAHTAAKGKRATTSHSSAYE